jgi:hypothetical protein
VIVTVEMTGSKGLHNLGERDVRGNTVCG